MIYGMVSVISRQTPNLCFKVMVLFKGEYLKIVHFYVVRSQRGSEKIQFTVLRGIYIDRSD